MSRTWHSPRGSRAPWWWKIASDILNDVWTFLTKDIWSLDLTKLSRLQAFGIRQAKVLIFVLRQYDRDKLAIRAASLTYSSLLAIVPFLAVVFSLLKGLGLYMNIEPALVDFLQPLGPRGEVIATKILEFVANAQTNALGAVGFSFLLWTVYGILNKIDTSYNEIWHVPRQRFWLRRLANYTLLIVVGPICIFIILAATASFTSIEFVQRILTHRFVTEIVEKGIFPYLVSGLWFTMIIWYVPNIRVRSKAALIGGFFSGSLWQLSNWAFARFVVGAGRASTRDILFAGFAALPLFLVWIYAGWVIVLLGAELGYVVQHVGVMEWRELEKIYGGTLRRFVGVRAVLGIIRDTAAKPKGPSLKDLAEEMKVPEPVIRDVLEPLVKENILTRSTMGEERYRPSRDPGSVTLAELLYLFKGQRSVPEKLISTDAFGQNIERLLHQIDSSLETGVTGLSLSDAASRASKGLSLDTT